LRVETIGDATLYLGASEDVLPTLPRVDAIVTDPPYGIYSKGGKWGRKQDHAWDTAPAEGALDLLSYGDAQIIWGGNYFPLPPSRGWLIWQKPDRNLSAADAELAWTSMDMNTRMISHTIAATNAERVGHPTQKPLRVMLWALSFLPKARLICDPYMGSGTTGVACAQAGRAFIGIEREERYFDMACQRIEQAYAQGQLLAHDQPKAEQLGIEC
jgi:site-specific DNA-methyltransferase (adenine-specific)